MSAKFPGFPTQGVALAISGASLRVFGAALLFAASVAGGQTPDTSKTPGYSFVLTNDSSRAASNNMPGYRMWVQATPFATRIQFVEHASPRAFFALVDRKTRVGIVPAKEDALEGSIDALGGPVGALAWPDEHPDRYRHIVVRDSLVAGSDTLLGTAATHRHFTLRYDEYDKHRITTEDCWYVNEPDVVHDAVDHATRFFGLSSAKDAALAFAVWAKTTQTPVKCTTVVTLDDRPQYPLRIIHETWQVSDVRTEMFDPSLFVPPPGKRVPSPHKPFKP